MCFSTDAGAWESARGVSVRRVSRPGGGTARSSCSRRVPKEDTVSTSPPLDSLGRRRSPASVRGYLAGRPPRSKGRRNPADPPRTEKIVAVMRCCGEGVHGARARALIVVLWRAGLRIQEALDLAELDLDPRRGSVLVR